MKEKIITQLKDKLKVESLEVTDNSHRHRGHAEWRPGGETHFSVVVISDDFLPLSRMERHRLIYQLLAEELQNGVHALTVRAYTPEEAKTKSLAENNPAGK